MEGVSVMEYITLHDRDGINTLFHHIARLSTHDNATQYIYMPSERKGLIENRVIIDHRFKNIKTSECIVLVESYRCYTSKHRIDPLIWESKYVIKELV